MQLISPNLTNYSVLVNRIYSFSSLLNFFAPQGTPKQWVQCTLIGVKGLDVSLILLLTQAEKYR